MKDAPYFPHDSNARADERLLELRAEYGWEGYGLWWALVEQLREATDYRLSNDRVGGLAMGLGVPKKQLESLLALCFDVGLLDLEDGYFFAPALRRRMEPWDTKRAALAEAGKRGAANRWAGNKPAAPMPEATPEPPQCPADSQAIATPLPTPMAIKVKESKEEESKEEEVQEGAASAAPPPSKKIEATPPAENPDAKAPHTEGGAADVGTPVGPLKASRGGKWQAPDVAAVAAYITEKRPQNPGCWQREAEAFVDYYTSNGWKVGRNPMQDWEASVRNWLKKVPEVGPAIRAAPGEAQLLPVPAFQRPIQSQVSQRQQVVANAKAKLLGQ